MYHEVVSPGSSSGRLEIYHPLSTSFIKPFLISRSLCVRDRSDDLITAIPLSFWNFLSSSNESASFSDGVATELSFTFSASNLVKDVVLFLVYSVVLFLVYSVVLFLVFRVEKWIFGFS